MKKNVPGENILVVRWLEKSLDDLESLREYIGKNNLIACEMVTKRIIKSVSLLANNPEMGRVGRAENTRELILSGLPYIIIYRVKNDFIEILNLFHGAMKWPAF